MKISLRSAWGRFQWGTPKEERAHELRHPPGCWYCKRSFSPATLVCPTCGRGLSAPLADRRPYNASIGGVATGVLFTASVIAALVWIPRFIFLHRIGRPDSMPGRAIVWVDPTTARFYAPGCLPFNYDSVWAVVRLEKERGYSDNEVPSDREVIEMTAEVQGMDRTSAERARRMGFHPARDCSFDEPAPVVAVAALQAIGLMRRESRWDPDGTWRW